MSRHLARSTDGIRAPCSRRAGFTLVELLIATGIAVVLLGAMFLMLRGGRQAWVSQDALLQVQQEARRALDAMTRELRGVNHINSPDTDIGIDFTDATRLNFQIDRGYNVAGCTSDAVCWGNDTTNDGWVHYLVINGQLARCQSDGADDVVSDATGCRIVANQVASFSADYADSSRTVTLHLQVTRTSSELGGGALSVAPAPLRAQVRLRNPS